MRCSVRRERSADVLSDADRTSDHHPFGPPCEFVHVLRIEVGGQFCLATPLFDDQKDVGTWRCLHIDVGGTLERTPIAETSDFGAHERLKPPEMFDECVTSAAGDRELCNHVYHVVFVYGYAERSVRGTWRSCVGQVRSTGAPVDNPGDGGNRLE